MDIDAPQSLQKRLLVDFWNYFLVGEKVDGGNKAKRMALTANQLEGKITRLNKLKEYADVKIPWKTNKIKNRIKFNATKESLHGSHKHLNRKCFVCLGQAHCRHHIIQMQNGGLNSKKNLVSLCHECHSAIHPWM